MASVGSSSPAQTSVGALSATAANARCGQAAVLMSKEIPAEKIFLPSMQAFPLKESALDFFSEKDKKLAHNRRPLSEPHHSRVNGNSDNVGVSNILRHAGQRCEM